MPHDLENTTHVNHMPTLNEEEREMNNTAVADVAGSQSLGMQNRTYDITPIGGEDPSGYERRYDVAFVPSP